MFGNIQDMMNLLQEFKQNPVNALARRNYSVPQGMTDPSQIMQHLLNTGQVTQNDINMANQKYHSPMMQQMMRQMFGH